MFRFPKQSLTRILSNNVSLDNTIIVDTYNNLRYKIKNDVIDIQSDCSNLNLTNTLIYHKNMVYNEYIEVFKKLKKYDSYNFEYNFYYEFNSYNIKLNNKFQLYKILLNIPNLDFIENDTLNDEYHNNLIKKAIINNYITEYKDHIICK
jgi:hypothetical protein